jgi:hypothetical protein
LREREYSEWIKERLGEDSEWIKERLGVRMDQRAWSRTDEEHLTPPYLIYFGRRI